MLTTVHLTGDMGKQFGDTHRFDVHNPGEVFRALACNFADFRSYLFSCYEKGLGFEVVIDNIRATSLDDLQNPKQPGEMTVTPAIHGAGSGKGVMDIVAGAALIALSGGLGTSFAEAIDAGEIATDVAGGAAAVISAVGYGFLSAGVTQLLMKKPDDPTNSQSYIFGGRENTSQSGIPVPIGYGTLRIGSIVIGAGVDVYGQSLSDPTVPSSVTPQPIVFTPVDGTVSGAVVGFDVLDPEIAASATMNAGSENITPGTGNVTLTSGGIYATPDTPDEGQPSADPDVSSNGSGGVSGGGEEPVGHDVDDD